MELVNYTLFLIIGALFTIIIYSGKSAKIGLKELAEERKRFSEEVEKCQLAFSEVIKNTNSQTETIKSFDAELGRLKNEIAAMKMAVRR